MSPGLLSSDRHSLSRVLVQQYRHWRSFLSRSVVAKSSPSTLSVIMWQPVPLTREPKRLTTGRLIKLLTSFAQPTKQKRNRWFGDGVNDVGTSSSRVTSRTRRSRCLWCWTSSSSMIDGEVVLTLVLMVTVTYITLMIWIGHLIHLMLRRLSPKCLHLMLTRLSPKFLHSLYTTVSSRLQCQWNCYKNRWS
jgi:hypothetical protein